MRVIIALAIIGAASAVPIQSKHGRIVGGDTTSIENYPFMANMLYDSWMGLFQMCGGTLITATTVVSASHCYVDDPPSAWRVRLGSSFASSGGIVHSLSRITLHPEFNFKLVLNDVSIMKLSSPAVFSNKINIARIAGPQYIVPDNTPIQVVGWGDTEFGGRPSEELRHVKIYTINQQLCAERYAYLKTQPDLEEMPDIVPEMFCAGILDVGGKDVCQGDSGGPVLHRKDILVGITSWSHECAHPTYPGVYVRVSSYIDWILANV